MHKYRLVSKKGEGTFSEVLKAQSVVTGKFVAVKCMKNIFKSIEQVNSLREIQALRRLNPHENIIELEEVLYDRQTGRLALVFELMDMNIYEMIRGRKQYVKPQRIKLLMYQLLKSVAHMHKNGIFHRDIKPENILVLEDGLKVADFGSCRGIFTKAPFTEYISTRWYRAPECLLTNGYYDFKMDVWGIGCVFFEVVSLFPLFPGTNELDQIEKVHNILGTPSQEVLDVFRRHSSHVNTFNFPRKDGTGIARLIPHASPDCIELIEMLLIYNPEKRITCKHALRHPFFRELREQERSKESNAASPSYTSANGSSNSSDAALASVPAIPTIPSLNNTTDNERFGDDETEKDVKRKKKKKKPVVDKSAEPKKLPMINKSIEEPATPPKAKAAKFPPKRAEFGEPSNVNPQPRESYGGGSGDGNADQHDRQREKEKEEKLVDSPARKPKHQKRKSLLSTGTLPTLPPGKTVALPDFTKPNQKPTNTLVHKSKYKTDNLYNPPMDLDEPAPQPPKPKPAVVAKPAKRKNKKDKKKAAETMEVLGRGPSKATGFGDSSDTDNSAVQSNTF